MCRGGGGGSGEAPIANHVYSRNCSQRIAGLGVLLRENCRFRGPVTKQRPRGRGLFSKRHQFPAITLVPTGDWPINQKHLLRRMVV